jgi:hypothetical protein
MKIKGYPENFEFESGRQAGIEWGERLERERIIKLLKDNYIQTLQIRDIIGLIEGDDGENE